jgi:hypothetical protein
MKPFHELLETLPPPTGTRARGRWCAHAGMLAAG